MTQLESLYEDIIFRLTELTWVGVLDLLLVAFTFYLLLNLMRRSRAASFLLRGALGLGFLLFVVSILLPLPAFDWLVRMALLTTLIATPIIFQPEIRRLLERLGRSTGLTRAVRQTTTEQMIPRLVRAAESMADSKTGALIVLEGNEPLQNVLETGVYIGGQVTSELLEAIFYPENPLHDGAIVIREDQIVAAGCVLPLTQQLLNFTHRLGTRHRAAVGVSESSEALAIVVSEETGKVSIARQGQLQYGLDSAALREQLFAFHKPPTPDQTTFSGWNLIGQIGRSIWQRPAQLDSRQFFDNLALFLSAILLATVFWMYLLEQTVPAKRVRFQSISLRVEGTPSPGVTLITQPPDSVSAIIQTTEQVFDTLSTDSFQAIVSLQDLSSGLHHLPVQVNSGASQVRVLSVEPPAVDLELAPVATRTISISPNLVNQQSLSPAYELVGSPTTLPDQVQVIGPAPLVERVSQVQTSISVANATTSLREIRPLKALDEAGREVTGVTLQPAQAQVNVAIWRRFNAVDVGVRAVTSGALPSGYWLSGLSVNPSIVTLQGDREQLVEIGSFIDTLPVDISQSTSDLAVEIPLNLPPDIQALDSNGNLIKTVTLLARISPRRGDLAITRPVELSGVQPGTTVTVDPVKVDLLLSGPLPVLRQIETNLELVRVLVDASSLTPGQNQNVTPTVVAPEGIRAQLVPPSVLVASPK
jgi:diadenylate cyclase